MFQECVVDTGVCLKRANVPKRILKESVVDTGGVSWTRCVKDKAGGGYIPAIQIGGHEFESLFVLFDVFKV